MSEYRRGFPSHDIRLRNWPAGRAAAMRLAISKLETTLNDTLAAQVEQSAARKLNLEIPFIIDLTVTAGFRQFIVDFSVPPGLGGTTRGASKHPDRQLLFYEIQHAATAAFSNPVIIQTPQTSILLSGFSPGQIRFFRARVINTKNEASPWTDTIQSRSARGRVFVSPMGVGDKSVRLSGDIGQWQTIFSEEYQAAAGSLSAMTHLAVGAIQENVGFYASGPAHVQFRWLVDINDTGEFREIEGGGRCAMAAIPGSTATTRGKAPMAFGTFLTPFITAPGTGFVNVKLQAMKRPGSETTNAPVVGFNLSANSGNYVSSATLTHWWRLGRDNTDIGKDYVGSIDMDVNAANITADDVFFAGTDASYVDFNGTDEYLANTGGNTFGLGASGSVAVWVRIDGSLGSSQNIVDFNVGTTQNNRWVIVKLSTDNFFFRSANAAGTGNDVTSTVPAVTSADLGKTWWHVVATKNGTTDQTIYVNGQATIDTTGGVVTSDASRRAAFAVNALNLSANFTDGAIHSVATWSTVLSAAEVTEIFNAGPGIRPGASDPLIFTRNSKVVEVIRTLG